jgi:hypothetical protein
MSDTAADRLFVLGLYAAWIVAGALFPRLAYLGRWPTRLGVRGLIAYAAFNALMLFAIRQFVVPRLNRWVEQQVQVKAELRRKLGREPTETELFEYFSRARDP